MKASIKTKHFIKFLKLFGDEGTIDELQLGDTMYKKEGWIDKTILKGNDSIEGILNLDYDFNGLQCFIGKINDFKIKMNPRNSEILDFEVESTSNRIRELEYKTIEQNAYNFDTFNFKYLKDYED